MSNMKSKTYILSLAISALPLLAACEKQEYDSAFDHYRAINQSFFGGQVDFSCAGNTWRYEKTWSSESLYIKEELGWAPLNGFASKENGIFLSVPAWQFQVPYKVIVEMITEFDLPIFDRSKLFNSFPLEYFKIDSRTQSPAEITFDLYKKNCLIKNASDVEIERRFFLKKYVEEQSEISKPWECMDEPTLEACLEKLTRRYKSMLAEKSLTLKELAKLQMELAEGSARKSWGAYERNLEERKSQIEKVAISIPILSTHKLSAGELVNEYSIEEK